MDYLASVETADKDLERILVLDVKHANLEDDFMFERAIRLLSLPQQAKIHQLKTVQGKFTTICNRLLQLFGCKVASGVPFGELRFDHGTYGKPRLKNCSQVSFSMSNGHDYVVQYICRRSEGCAPELGVDIASKNDYLGDEDLEVFRDVFSDTEYKHLLSLGVEERKSTFAFYWSLKECYSKFTGLGLNCNLKELDYGQFSAPATSSASQKVIDKTPMLFYSAWISPYAKEIVTVCRQNVLQEPDLSCWLKSGPPVHRLTLEDVVEFLEAEANA